MKGATLVFFFSQTKHTNFNPRSREGSDIPPQNLIISKINFNPRSREGSDISLLTDYLVACRDFNPRSREGSDGNVYDGIFPLYLISIHAPVKGATGLEADNFLSMYISIHAPVKGATILCFSHTLIYMYFNPRSREGSDRFSLRL